MKNENGNYERYNAEHILEVLSEYIDKLEDKKAEISKKKKECRWAYYRRPALEIDDVYENLSIFDWFKSELSLTNLKDMYDFVNRAVRLGFKGYVCFKVGATGCSNGMWCHVQESTDGHSPDGDFIYRSFTPDYVSWDAEIDGELLSEKYILGHRNVSFYELKKYLKKEEE